MRATLALVAALASALAPRGVAAG
jgi:hypothetical protein